MTAYAIEQLDQLELSDDRAILGMDMMSPYVWREGDAYRLLFRAVQRPFTTKCPTGLIYCGRSKDGLDFEIEDGAVIAPGPAPEDAGGCEDPTLVRNDKAGDYRVYYTGVDAARAQGSLLVAEGPDVRHLKKRAVMLKAPPGAGNIKEATLVQTASGDWRLFFEYAAHNLSRIGVASGPCMDGPWTIIADPFSVRERSWDNSHLSTGPIAFYPGQDPVMFYNGATLDARWRIGWVSFDRDFTRVTGRGLEPLLVPPPARDRAATDIAFAASSIVENHAISLYYSLEDRTLHRAIVSVYDHI
ncbi:MAG: hypothetical protein WAU68_12100 [Vitreimonas sp.]